MRVEKVLLLLYSQLFITFLDKRMFCQQTVILITDINKHKTNKLIHIQIYEQLQL